MDEESFNMSVRKFLKKLGITAQREIERAVLEGIANGQLKGDETLTAKVQITLITQIQRIRYPAEPAGISFRIDSDNIYNRIGSCLLLGSESYLLRLSHL